MQKRTAMGIIAKQTIKGTIWSYLGVIIGFVTTTILYPNYLTPEVVGLFGLLASYSSLMGKLYLLGLPGVTNRLFSYFRNYKNGHNGFLFIALLFHVIGIVLFILTYFIFKPLLVESNLESSPLFVQYIYLLLPMTIAVMIFTFLDAYNKMLYNAVFGTFLQEFFQRFLILSITLLYVFKIVGLKELIVLYAVVISIKAVIILVFLMNKKEINLRPNLMKLDKKMRTEIKSVALFSLAGGVGSLIVFNLDKIIINQMLNLSKTGVYTIAFYFGSLIAMPSRPLLKISGTLIADAWKNNDIQSIKQIYSKSCLNQLIIGGVLFLGIWANIENILIILGDDYSEAKWVIFFIGIGYLVDMATGTNAQIIAYSKSYRISLVFILILVVLLILSMYLLIPLYGIKGAALAIAISLIGNNLMRYLFLYKKYGLQPFNIDTLIILAILILTYFAQSFLPAMNLVADILLRSSLIVLLITVSIKLFSVSDEANLLIDNILRKIKHFLFK